MDRLLLDVGHVLWITPLHMLSYLQNSLSIFVVYPLVDRLPSLYLLLEFMYELNCFDAIHDACGGYASDCCGVDPVIESIFFTEHLSLAKLGEADIHLLWLFLSVQTCLRQLDLLTIGAYKIHVLFLLNLFGLVGHYPSSEDFKFP